ncbi:hypothetical protein CAEBREN_16235 [Caenorhabditis brenneri]|uniref:Cyclin N-terminal domain-containing protein n=1 Tax=Caenorhabditis brenneri TaxID=135651 RepID=G0MJV2_CAEBE|nr:hypothetical protein CAEBREN_16235 [Caenorhabditis brenneri]
MRTALSLKPSNAKAAEEGEAANHKLVKNENQPLRERKLTRQNGTSNLHRELIPIKKTDETPSIQIVSKEEFEVYEDPDPVENVPKKVDEKENDENDENRKEVAETQSEKDNSWIHELERKMEEKVQKMEEKRQKEDQKKKFMLPRDNNDITLGCSEPSSEAVTISASCDDDDYDKISVASSTFTTAIRASLSTFHVDVEASIEEEKKKISVMRKKAEKEYRDDLMYASEEYYLDILKYMIFQQTKNRPSSTSFSRQKHLNEEMRSILVDWFSDVVKEYGLQKETFHLAVNLVDRVLSSLEVEKAQFQLVGTTCLMIAAKYEEIFPPEIAEFAIITDNTYRVPEILSMERFILAKFRFIISVPTASWFGTCFAKRMQFTSKMSRTMNYLLDLSLIDVGFLRYRPSDIGAAAICFTNIQHEKEAWPEKMIEETGLKTDNFLYVLKDLHEMYIYASTSDYKSIFNRYSDIDEKEVALYPAPSDKLKKLFPTVFGVAPKATSD